MRNFKIGLQLYSVREDMAADFEGTLKKVKAMGYDGVEFAGLYGKTPCEVRKICDDIGLEIIAAHVGLPDMAEDPSVIDQYVELQCKYIIVSYLRPQFYPNTPGFKKVISTCKEVGERAKKLEMSLCYHNHWYEFFKENEEYGFDLIYKNVPSDLLKAEPDTCWIKVGGEEPSEYIEKYAGRIDLLHLKDFYGSREETPTYNENEPPFEFRPLGKGVLNFVPIIAAAEKAGVQWLVVEQDAPSMELSSVECAKVSIDFLKSII